MVTSSLVSQTTSPPGIVITWEPLPQDLDLEDEPVDNTGQPLLAGALRESLEIAGFIQPQMLIAANFGLCATLDGQFIAKAPDWLYVPVVKEILPDRKSYTPHLEGDIPAIVMEFLSDKEGGEYSVKRTYPPGKWFFYEQILQVPVYVIFEPEGGLLEYYQLENGRYELKSADENGRHWVESMGLFLGTWRGDKEGRSGYWLRWWDNQGNLLPWAVEKILQERQRAEQERQRAEQERQRAEQERQRAEQERQRAEQERQEKEKLRAYLQSRGIDPDIL
ncbi:Uma2 family endonuclease [Anabaenopsis arnoldii]|uniref:Uma2 family endonuclease n=1 Tax=Anabaenopsis arnoldii TaxID=2152938 RepID=A0ABT5APE9_9CYAN|nr:Uma2 family endonuclease [Anabaenopsis arnoldii]MDB9539190.1 Uma2 family endonuclease [Anabaenopsis arnoldii]MDH6091478.1 Uma2 family endonuclease [Anabaenopsis arnoldii]